MMIPKQTEYKVGMYLRLSKDDERAGESLSMCIDLIEYITLDENTRKLSEPRNIHIYYKLIDEPLKDKTNALA